MSSPEYSAEDPVNLWQEVFDELRAAYPKMNAESDPEIGRTIFYTEEKTTMGVLQYQINTYENHIRITFYGVTPAFQQNGISRALIARTLIQHPKVQKITATLGASNYEPFIEMLKSGVSPYEVLELTPFYKALAALGFDMIEQNDENMIRGHFTVKRKT